MVIAKFTYKDKEQISYLEIEVEREDYISPFLISKSGDKFDRKKIIGQVVFESITD